MQTPRLCSVPHSATEVVRVSEIFQLQKKFAMQSPFIIAQYESYYQSCTPSLQDTTMLIALHAGCRDGTRVTSTLLRTTLLIYARTGTSRARSPLWYELSVVATYLVVSWFAKTNFATEMGKWWQLANRWNYPQKNPSCYPFYVCQNPLLYRGWGWASRWVKILEVLVHGL
jgi:hypothetical protein